MKSIELSEVAALTPLVLSGDREPVILTQDGHAVAAVVPGDEHDVDNLLLSVHPKFQEILERSQRSLDNQGGLSSDEVRKRLGLPSAGADS